jgi:hypothetical protein
MQGGMCTIRDRFALHRSEVQQELDLVKRKTELDLAGRPNVALHVSHICLFTELHALQFIPYSIFFHAVLQKEVDEVDEKLKTKQIELHGLMNYKV